MSVFHALWKAQAILFRIPKIVNVIIFGNVFYEKKYLKSKWFASPLQLGWEVASRDIFYRFMHGKNIRCRFPVSPDIDCGPRVVFDPDDNNNFFGSGCYFQTWDEGDQKGTIYIGKGTFIAKNVGIITSNHDLIDPDKHKPPKDVIIGKKCWIGMNAIILPGVVLGDHTIVGAGSVVTNSFTDGKCVIAGNPAQLVRTLAFFDGMEHD